ncbi:MAG: alpha-E domain-containing protein [Solirubrobacteraceae bacterium]|nr:alpha-E domain-containing protein [Patulibacter sp.]
MLSRIAQELFWLGRNVARAEHTARMLDGVFQASLQSAAYSSATGTSTTVRLDWGSIVAIMGAVPDPGESSTQVLRRMTLDRNEPSSLISCIDRAREGARTVRDVVSAEMWEAINTTQLTLAQGDLQGQLAMGPYSVFQYVRERSATFWGLTSRTMLRDDASAFLTAGGRIESADMVLRMLRVAMPDAEPMVSEQDSDEVSPSDRPVEATGLQDAQAQALLHAVGGFQAFRRAVPSPPHAGPVARFLLYERSYPDSVAASVDALQRALTNADEVPRRSEPVLRLTRLGADLEFRGRTAYAGTPEGTLAETCEAVQAELTLVDRDISERYFSGATPASGLVLA